MLSHGAKISIEQRVEGWRSYYARSNARPLLGFFAGSDYPLHRYPAARRLPEDRPLRPEDLDAAAYADDSDRLFDLHEACGGDSIWSASAFWGIPWLEALVGCPVRADHATGSIRAEPPPGFAGDRDIPPFDACSPWARKAVELIETLAARSGGRWPIGTTRMRGIADLLSALYGADAFLYAMMDRPEEVAMICRKLTDIWIAFGELQLEHIPLFHGGLGSFYYNLWAPAGTIWHQEDAAALLSPDLYDRFIAPHDRRIAGHFAGCIMHHHPAGFMPTDFYIEMPFLAVELHVDEAGPTARELLDVYLRILERKPLLIWGRLSRDDMDWILERLPARGLAVMTMVSGPAEAHQVWTRYVT